MADNRWDGVERRAGTIEVEQRMGRIEEGFTRLQSELRQIRRDQSQMKSAMETLIAQGHDQVVREDERARLLAEADKKRADALEETARLLEIQKTKTEIRWTPVQKILAVTVVVIGGMSLALEVWLNVVVR
jgi:hypothetical protein